MSTKRFCEFTGSDNEVWDGELKKSCEWLGFSSCTLHKVALKEWQGWRVCCDVCTCPVQVKETTSRKRVKRA